MIPHLPEKKIRRRQGRQINFRIDKKKIVLLFFFMAVLLMTFFVEPANIFFVMVYVFSISLFSYILSSFFFERKWNLLLMSNIFFLLSLLAFDNLTYINLLLIVAMNASVVTFLKIK